MTEEQFNHYIKGGKFTAVYNPPKTSDLSQDNLARIGRSCVVYQNMIISPLQSPESHKGQHAFDADIISGWCPEEDFENLTILDEFREHFEPTPQYLFRLDYTNPDSIKVNFGTNSGLQVPCSVYREYGTDNENYVLKLSDPQADEIFKYVWKGEYQEKIEWVSIFKKTS